MNHIDRHCPSFALILCAVYKERNGNVVRNRGLLDTCLTFYGYYSEIYKFKVRQVGTIYFLKFTGRLLGS
jgi:hypothetical protein